MTVRFYVLAIILFTLSLIGGVIAMKGIDRPGDLALFGGTALASLSAFALMMLTLSHFSPLP